MPAHVTHFACGSTKSSKSPPQGSGSISILTWRNLITKTAGGRALVLLSRLASIRPRRFGTEPCAYHFPHWKPVSRALAKKSASTYFAVKGQCRTRQGLCG